ncbi:hypothetical protein [Halostella litorea]|uniref:hypothetical protein n=1 Tax=Halostella litorea TaxID=2528831 RepID=UPI0013874714|nr:hypothetical protein [Halostella litorea]
MVYDKTMSKSTPAAQKSSGTTRTDTYDQSRFTAVDEIPRCLDANDLDACAPPRAREGDTERFYAVGRLNGVISYGPDELQNADGCRVLYMSPGQRVVEYQFAATADEFADIPVSIDVPTDAEAIATPADRVADRYAPVLAIHAEREGR